MTAFVLDLPFYVPLEDGEYTLNVDGREIPVRHSVVEHPEPDPRAGGLTGDFGFVRDPLGLLRYSRLAAELSEADLEHLGSVLLGVSPTDQVGWNYQDKGRVALAMFNRFLDKYRAATRKLDVRPVGQWDPAVLRFEDGSASGALSLYGGGITLPPAGLVPAAHERVVRQLAEPKAPETYELAALDAQRAIENGMADEALIIAFGALESAVDRFLARSWRLGQPRVGPKDAAKQLKPGAKDSDKDVKSLRTIEDLLEWQGIAAKLRCGAITQLAAPPVTAGLEEANDVRNLVVHGGARIPASKAWRHVQATTGFVLDTLATTIRRDFPTMPRPEVLSAYEEAMGAACPAELDNLAAQYLAGVGLEGKLYNRKAEPGDMWSELYGDTVVMRIDFDSFQPDQIELFVARALLRHWLDRRGDVAFARPGKSRWVEQNLEFWSEVASVMNSAVRMAAIDRRLRDIGFDTLVRQDVQQRESELSQMYGASYTTPSSEQIGHFVAYMPLARVAAALPVKDRDDLLQRIGSAAPADARHANLAVPAVERADLHDPASILEALVAVHDANGAIAGSVVVFDPKTRTDQGLGTKVGDLGQIVARL